MLDFSAVFVHKNPHPLQMLEVFWWLVDPRVGLAVLVVFCAGCNKARNAKKTFMDRACQTDAEENWEALEGSSKNSKRDVGTQAVPGEKEKMSPYVWDYAYWPSEGGI